MAKKIVRGITDVKTITNQDYDTNNVNDLLSDGQYNYIHRKKGKSEEYHNLTDNLKTLSSDNTDLLQVTNYNKTTNKATLSPKHDAQKEQVLASQNNTITINHGANDSNENTKIDVNTHKVLTHNNLLSSSPLITIEHQEGQDTTTIKTTKLEEKLNSLGQNQNTENYYICLEDVAGTMTLTKLENDIVVPNLTVKAVLEYSLYVRFDKNNQADVEKLIEPPIKNIEDNSGEYGVYTDVSNPSLFTGLLDGYRPGEGHYYDNGALKTCYDGVSSCFSVLCDREKVDLDGTHNVTGKMLVVENTYSEGGGGIS